MACIVSPLLPFLGNAPEVTLKLGKKNPFRNQHYTGQISACQKSLPLPVRHDKIHWFENMKFCGKGISS